MTSHYEARHRQLVIVEQIEEELERANVDGISRDVLPNAREGQLAGYLAGLQKALELASRA